MVQSTGPDVEMMLNGMVRVCLPIVFPMCISRVYFLCVFLMCIWQVRPPAGTRPEQEGDCLSAGWLELSSLSILK